MEPQQPKDREQLRRSRHEGRASATFASFMRELSERAGVDREQAEEVALAVLSALEQRLARNEAHDLESELPSQLRELLSFYEKRDDLRPRDINRNVFMSMVAEDLAVEPDKAEEYVRAVFETLTARVSPGEIAEVINMLPHNFRELWPIGAGRS